MADLEGKGTKCTHLELDYILHFLVTYTSTLSSLYFCLQYEILNDLFFVYL
jgi:hypothetical protein